MSFIYEYKTYTLTPCVKPHAILNLAVRNEFYMQYEVVLLIDNQNHIIINTKRQKIDQKIFTHNVPNGLRGIHNYVQSGVSVTRRKSPNVYKSYPKMISLEK